MWNPPFNDARGSTSTIQLKPPFRFHDMTVAVLPLRADLSQLTNFCDKYLNQDSDLVRFEPFLPYVYLMIIDYGKMSIEAADMGWVSQCEVAFTVPLKWMVKKDNEWVFYDWAVNCPYIFVDNELSMTTGREVYGWPKVLARIDPTNNDWISDVRAASKVFEVKTQAINQTYQNQTAGYETFLAVRHKAIPNFLDMPPNLDGLLSPLTKVPNTALNFFENYVDMTKTFGGIALNDFTLTPDFPNLLDPEFYKRNLTTDTLRKLSDPTAWRNGIGDMIWSLFPRSYMNTINLKQFRDASSPWKACYQAITSSRMSYESVKSVVPLGQQNLALGQIDGGFDVDIHRFGNQPVVEALGLQVNESRPNGDTFIDTLSPVLPFWLKVDMTYGRGWTIEWRDSTGGWNEGRGLTYILSKLANSKGETKPTTSANKSDTKQTDDRAASSSAYRRVSTKSKDPAQSKPSNASANADKKTRPRANPYNTARGAAIQELSGPFSLPNTTIRVLPLIADEATLNRFVGKFLNVDQHARFEAWGNIVYLIVYTYKDRTSASDNVGLFSGREVNFSVPVKQFRWYEESKYDLSTDTGRSLRDQQEFVSAGLVTPFSYVDDAVVAISSSEVHGIPTLKAELGSPASTWMDTSGPKASQNLLSTSALVLPAVGVGAGASHQAFVNVTTESIVPESDQDSWRHIAHKWGPRLVEDLERKYSERGWRDAENSENKSFDRIRALLLEVLAGKIGINNFTLKQFRDAYETENACYQAIVKGHKKIERVHEIHEIQDSLNVWINKFPTQPVSKILGLKPKYVVPGNNVEVFEAIRPFWFRADILEQLGETLFERVADEQWTVPQMPEQLAGWQNIAVEELEKHAHDATAQLSWLERTCDGWKRMIKTIVDPAAPEIANEHTADNSVIAAVRKLTAQGNLRDLMIYCRYLPRPLMYDAAYLDHFDRKHVSDIGAFVDSHQQSDKTYTSAAELGVDFGRITPATILDSAISRQWGRPDDQRDLLHSADYRINVDTFGRYYKDALFPAFERRDKFWPQSGDDQIAMDNQRIGLTWRCWDEIWSIVQLIDEDPDLIEQQGFETGFYRTQAQSFLPQWFAEDKAQRPARWGLEEFSHLAVGLRNLIEWSQDKVDQPVAMRNLNGWLSFVASMQTQLSETTIPDPSGKPPTEGAEKVEPNVAAVLKRRLNEIARE